MSKGMASKENQDEDNSMAYIRKPVTGDVDIMDLNPCCSVCCCIASCFTVWPDCCGCSGSQVMLCFKNEIIAFKKSI